MGHVEAERVETREQCGGRRRAAGVHVHPPVERARGRVLADHREHGRGAAEVGDALGPEEPPDLAGVDRPQAHVRAAGAGHRPGEAPAVAVEHRQRPQVARLRSEPCVVRHRGGLERRAPVVVHHSLGLPGRPARVVEREHRALVDRAPVRRVGRLGQPRVVLLVLDDQPDARLLGEGRRGLGELPGRHQERGAGVLEDVGHLRLGQPDVDRHQYAATHRHRVVQLEHDVAVGAQRRDPVALPDAGPRQRAHESGAAVGQLAVREPDLAVHHGGPVREDRGRPVEEGRRRQGSERELGAVRVGRLGHPITVDNGAWPSTP